ncbi:hypothetical protein WNY63_02425 [Pseudoalteromonas neustonica]|uniref:HNH endonuclease n=1 Tax=Pseudoalteromonas neustonica TaxID=1840331 RepID=A0ABU9TZH2_9GAMM
MPFEPINFSEKALAIITRYDLQDHNFWSEAESIDKVRKEIRDHYLPIQEYRCAYCNNQNLETHGLVWDCEHFLPKKGYPKFMFEPKNLVISCKSCNLAKENYKAELLSRGDNPKFYPEEANDFKLIHPIFENYADYFKIISKNDNKIIEPLDNLPEEKKEKAEFTFRCCNFKRFVAKYAGYDHFREDFLYAIQKLQENNGEMTGDEILQCLENPNIGIERKFF